MTNQETFEHIKAGTRLWNGAIVTPQLADTYNSLQDRMAGFVRRGLPVPEYLRNGSHNLLAGYTGGSGQGWL